MKKTNPQITAAWIVGILTIIGTVIAALIGVIFPYLPQIKTTEVKTNLSMQQKTAQANTIHMIDPNLSLRKLTPLETGKSPKTLPDDIYGFGSNIYINALFSDFKTDLLVLYSDQRYKDYFEVQKERNNLFLIGYVNNEIYSNASQPSESHPLQLTLFAQPWIEYQYAVTIPFDSIKKSSTRDIETVEGKTISVLDLQVSALSTQASPHKEDYEKQ